VADHDEVAPDRNPAHADTDSGKDRRENGTGRRERERRAEEKKNLRSLLDLPSCIYSKRNSCGFVSRTVQC
jgi:hypothetical protein